MLTESLTDPTPTVQIDTAHDSLREEIQSLVRVVGKHSLKLAFAIAKVYRDRHYVAWGYTSFPQYLDKEVPLHRSSVYRLANIGLYLGSIEAEVIERHERGEITVNELVTISKKLDAGMPKDVAIQAIRYGTPLPEEYATVEKQATKKITVPSDLADIVEKAYCAARFQLEKDSPSDSEILELIAVNYLHDFEREADLSRLQHTMRGGRTIQFSIDNVLNGEIRCKECGTWRKDLLQPHHVIPRSKGGEEGVIVLVCGPCHAALTPVWEEWAKQHGLL